MKELHILAAFVHGMLTSLHGLGLVYNIRRRNWTDVAVHMTGLLYSARSAVGHHQDARDEP